MSMHIDGDDYQVVPTGNNNFEFTEWKSSLKFTVVDGKVTQVTEPYLQLTEEFIKQQ